MGTYENDENQSVEQLKQRVQELTARLLEVQEDENDSIRISLEQFQEYGRLKIWYNQNRNPMIHDAIARLLFEDLCQHQKDHKWPYSHDEGFGIDNLVNSLMRAYTKVEAQHEFADAIVKGVYMVANEGESAWARVRNHFILNIKHYLKKNPLPDNTPLEMPEIYNN